MSPSEARLAVIAAFADPKWTKITGHNYSIHDSECGICAGGLVALIAVGERDAQYCDSTTGKTVADVAKALGIPFEFGHTMMTNAMLHNDLHEEAPLDDTLHDVILPMFAAFPLTT
jgi:hypothetical protein